MTDRAVRWEWHWCHLCGALTRREVDHLDVVAECQNHTA